VRKVGWAPHKALADVLSELLRKLLRRRGGKEMLPPNLRIFADEGSPGGVRVAVRPPGSETWAETVIGCSDADEVVRVLAREAERARRMLAVDSARRFPEVPNLVGQRVEQAEGLLAGRGLRMDVRAASGTWSGSAIVRHQVPRAGAKVRRGWVVQVEVD